MDSRCEVQRIRSAAIVGGLTAIVALARGAGIDGAVVWALISGLVTLIVQALKRKK